jgi:hypothetical protein
MKDLPNIAWPVQLLRPLRRSPAVRGQEELLQDKSVEEEAR